MDRLGMRWLLVLAAWAWFAPVVEIGSNAMTSDPTDMMVFATWVSLWIAWMTLHKPMAHKVGWSVRIAWFAVPCLLVLGAVVYGSEWSMAARVWLCEDELRAYAERADDAWHPQAPPVKVGLFEVHATDRYAGVTDLMTRHDSFDVSGVTYAPNGLPPWSQNHAVVGDKDRPGGYRHLYGPWYRRVIRD